MVILIKILVIYKKLHDIDYICSFYLITDNTAANIP